PHDVLHPAAPFAFERSGALFLAQTEAVLNKFRRNVAMQNGLGIPSGILSAAEIAERWPRLSAESIVGGSFCAEDGFIEDCHGITHLLAGRARQRGARVLREEATQIVLTDGRWRVTTDAGQLETGRLRLAAGCGARPPGAPDG